MGKIIIDNRSDKPDAEIVRMVAGIIDAARVSNNGKQYCYGTVYKDKTVIVSDLNKKSDRFIAYIED